MTTNNPGSFENPVTAVLHTKRDNLDRFQPAAEHLFLELLQITPVSISGRTFKNVIITKDCYRELKKFGEDIYTKIIGKLSNCVASCGGSVTVEER